MLLRMGTLLIIILSQCRNAFIQSPQMRKHYLSLTLTAGEKVISKNIDLIVGLDDFFTSRHIFVFFILKTSSAIACSQVIISIVKIVQKLILFFHCQEAS